MYLAHCSTDKYRQAQPKILIVHIEITRACWIGQTLDGTAFGLVKQNGSQFLSPIKIFSFSLGSKTIQIEFLIVINQDFIQMGMRYYNQNN